MSSGAPNTVTPANVPLLAQFSALLDSGATGTCISTKVAQSLGLGPVGLHPVHGVTGTKATNIYLVDIVIPMASQSGYIIKGLKVAEMPTHVGSSYEILLGRDILCRGVFTMGHDGHFSLSL